MFAAPLVRAGREASRCNRCGFCQTACPVYQVTRKESSTARGHHYQVRNAVEERLTLSPDLAQPLDECLLCRACVPHCAPKVQTDQVVTAARHALAGANGRTRALTSLLRKLLLRPERLGRYARMAAAARHSGLARMASSASPSMSRAYELVPNLNARTLQDRTGDMVLEPPKPRGRVAYFAGCGMSYLMPQAGEATIRLLVSAGFAVSIARNYCCGLPLHANGDPVTARRLARGNLRLLKADSVDAIVTDCASCSSFLKGYGRLLEDDPAHAPAAERFSASVMDITEFLDREGLSPIAGETRLTVTYHDPCHASRYQGLRDEPRRVLQKIPGVRFVEMDEADWCCGGAGTYSVAHPELSGRILDRKMENAARTGADVLVTSCPSCMLQLSYGVRRLGLSINVLHLSEVAVALGAKAGTSTALSG